MLGKVGRRWGVKLARSVAWRIARLVKRMHGDLSCVDGRERNWKSFSL